MSYAHLFEQPANEIEDRDIVIELAELTPEQRNVILQWVASQADKAAAKARMREILAAVLFEVTAAELGALLHRPGSA